MDSLLNTNTPLSYNEWVKNLKSFSDTSQQAYLVYLNSWYDTNNMTVYEKSVKNTKKQQYIQLIKDVSYLFNSDERDLFLSEIDYNKEEDLIYIIPYVVQKLKEISQIICAKREELKYSKTKHSMVGSDQAVEKILYEYVLKNFTKKDYSYTQIPISPLQNVFPELSSVNQDFFIEVEELYDTDTYFDSDPSVDISNYFDLNKLASYEPFQNLSEDELTGLLATRFLPKVSETPLSKIFNKYIESFTTTLSSVSAYAQKELYNRIAANQNYLSEDVYALTAVKTGEANIPDYTFNLSFEQGNNWFYWPSGDKVIDTDSIGNIYKPIPINESNLVLNRTVSGSSYVDSDLIFTDKNGTIQGAWLQGIRKEKKYDKISLNINAGEKRYFIYPFVGFDIDSKSFSFKNYSLNDNSYDIFRILPTDIKKNILTSYYNNNLPVSAAFDVYLNQTSLLSAGAYAGYFSDQADTIVKRPSANLFVDYSDYITGESQGAFLYKFDETEIYVGSGDNNIMWPLGTYNPDSSIIPITVDDKTCLPVNLIDIKPKTSMVGSIAGTTIDTSDVIYKVQTRGNNIATEAAWLGTGSISQLDILKNTIPVYSKPAVNCADFVDGPILSSLSLKINPGDKTSFIWMDQDTPADQVFKFRKHADGCFYGKTFPHDFYQNQDYQNIAPLNSSNDFPLVDNPCTCRSVYYSPIGNEGNSPTDYNGMTDYLFADPQGVGENFNVKTWVDTRDFDAFNSPQFAFYQLDGTMDKNVGFGTGKWKTGDGSPLILKTGRRYTYARTSLRQNAQSSTVPYLLVNYPYQKITVNCPSGYTNKTDLFLLIDNSRTQKRDVEMVKNIATDLCTKILSNKADVLIGLISFAKDALVLNYLSGNLGTVVKNIKDIVAMDEYPKYLTNIKDALVLADNLLFTNKPYGNNCDLNDITALCSNLNVQIANNSGLSLFSNCPRSDAAKKIVIFSDGQETYKIGEAVPYSEQLKEKGIEITCLDIGYYSPENNVMEDMATKKLYYNIERLLKETDFDEYAFNQYISLRLVGCFPAVPTWCKAIRNQNGTWVGTSDPSDMVLNPGDYLLYNHKSSANYTTQNGNNFSNSAISFTINTKLNGWDYATNTFDPTFVGDQYGAKPYWGQMYLKDDLDFAKKTIYFGGHIRFLNDYVPVHQPVVSDIKFTNGCFIEYTSKGTNNINWVQDLTFNVSLTSQQWNKLIISEGFSNLSFALETKNLQDLIVDYTYEPSDILLESYSEFQPAFYNFYLRNSSFVFNQNLYYINSCPETFVTFTTGKVLEVSEPYANLTNVFFPTVATIDFPSNMVSKKQISYYLTPDKLGASFYRGRGYEITLDGKNLTYLDSVSGERLFLDLNKYGPRNRGLTKKDQLSPVTITDIDNRWMMHPYTSNNIAGVINDTVFNQKLSPYMSNYETDNYNNIGISLQKDNFSFWNTNYNNNWSDNLNYPLTLRKEVNIDSYNKRIDALLTDKGNLVQWRTDIYGNNFGLYKV